jgi:hypothetical protein
MSSMRQTNYTFGVFTILARSHRVIPVARHIARSVPITAQSLCSWCKEEVGDDLLADDIECLRSMRGENNRRHKFLQHALFNILKPVSQEWSNIPFTPWSSLTSAAVPMSPVTRSQC